MLKRSLLLGVSGLSLSASLAVSMAALVVTPNVAEASGVTNTGVVSSYTNASGVSISIYNNTNTGSVGTLTNSGTISSDSEAIFNSGTINTIINSASGLVSGAFAGIDVLSGIIGSVNNLGTIVSTVGSAAIYFSGSVGTLTNSGLISDATGKGVWNAGSKSITALTNNAGGTISGKTAIYNNGGYIGTVTNNGSIKGTTYGIDNFSNGGGSIGLLSNSGTISAGTAVNNASSIGTITDSGLIEGTSGRGIMNNSASIGLVTISTGGTISGKTAFYNAGGTINTITNSGSIIGGTNAFLNTGNVGSLINNGLISDTSYQGVANYGTITALTNGTSGTISGKTALYAAGSINTLTNNGDIVGSKTGIWNGSGTINALINAGTISSSATTGYAIKNSATIGTLTNSGLISGNVSNSAIGLTIAGGSSTYGIFSGGTITSTVSGINLISGDLVLADAVNMGSGTLTNSGANLKVASAVTITGNYTQTGGGLVINENTGSIGSISVSGAAVITGSAITISGTGLTAGEKFTIVSGSSVTATSDTYTLSGTSGLLISGTVSGNNLVVSLASPTSYAPVGAINSSIGQDIGAVVDQIKGGTSATATAFQNTVISAVSALSGTKEALAIKQLGPSSVGVGPVASHIAASPSASAVELHGLALLSPSGDSSNGAAVGAAAVGAAAGSDALTKTGWAQVLGGWSQRNNDSNGNGYTGSSYGFVAGVDTQPLPNAVAGVALSYVKGFANGTGSSSNTSASVDSYQVTGYGTYRVGAAFVEGQANVGINQYTQSRALSFLNETASSSYGGMQYLGKIGAGYDFKVNTILTLTPIVGLQAVDETTRSYMETGAGAANLSVNSASSRSVTQDVGVKLATVVPTVFGDVTSEGKLAWVHDYVQGATSTSGILGGSTFTTSNSRVAPDGAALEVAVSVASSNNVTVRAEYSGEVRQDYQNHTGLLRVTIGF